MKSAKTSTLFIARITTHSTLVMVSLIEHVHTKFRLYYRGCKIVHNGRVGNFNWRAYSVTFLPHIPRITQV